MDTQAIPIAFVQFRLARALETATATGLTCVGCKCYDQGGDWGQENCERMMDRGLCQKQVVMRLAGVGVVMLGE